MRRLALLICTVFWASLAVALSGCGVSLEVYRIDERVEEQKQIDKPLKCWFWNCGAEVLK